MGLFSKLFGSKISAPPELERPSNHLAFVLLKEAKIPNGKEIIEAYEKYSDSGLKLDIKEDEIDTEKAEESEMEILMLDIDSIGTAFIALMPIPVPNGEAEARFEFSLSALSNEAKIQEHSAHLMITLALLDDKCSPKKALMEFTSLLAAIVEKAPSVGVYWGNAGATHSADLFTSIAIEKSVSPRITLWNGMSRAPEANNRMSFLSYGMHQLALPNLYLTCKIEEASEAMGRFYDLLAYVADRGEAIPNGDTIGISEEEKIKVEYCKSPADKKEVVMKVDL